MSRQLAVVTDYDTLQDALRDRADELQASRATIDDLAGLPSGYSGKLLGKAQVRGITKLTLGPLLQTLGLKLIVVEDKETTAKIRRRITPRREGLVRHRAVAI